MSQDHLPRWSVSSYVLSSSNRSNSSSFQLFQSPSQLLRKNHTQQQPQPMKRKLTQTVSVTSYMNGNDVNRKLYSPLCPLNCHFSPTFISFVSPGCYVDGKHYEEGEQLPSDPEKPCELCYCIQNSSTCALQECQLSTVTGCQPIYGKNKCCPVKYNCSSENAKAMEMTTKRPTVFMDLISGRSEGCRYRGRVYSDGEQVTSNNKCEHCYCMRNEIVCAIQECQPPCDDCTPIWGRNKGQCCPEKYECCKFSSLSFGFFSYDFV